MRAMKKIMVLVIVGLFIGTGIIPNIASKENIENETSMMTVNNRVRGRVLAVMLESDGDQIDDYVLTNISADSHEELDATKYEYYGNVVIQGEIINLMSCTYHTVLNGRGLFIFITVMPLLFLIPPLAVLFYHFIDFLPGIYHIRSGEFIIKGDEALVDYKSDGCCEIVMQGRCSFEQ